MTITLGEDTRTETLARIEELVWREWVPSWREHDGMRMQRCFHPGGTYSDPYFGTVAYSDIPTVVTRLARRVHQLDFKVCGPLSLSGWNPPTCVVALEWEMTGAVTRLRVPVRLRGCDFLEFSGGRILRARTYFDLYGFALSLARAGGRRLLRLP